MRNIAMLCVCALFICACNTAKKSTNASPEKSIKGEWQLNEVSFSDYANVRVLFFDDVYKDCLSGSNWKFVPNNNRGSYTVNRENCLSGTRNFIFVLEDLNMQDLSYDLLIKPTDEKFKSTDNKGFRMRLSQLSSNAMEWKQKVSIDEKELHITFNFTKITEL